MTTRKQLVGQIQRPGRPPENITFVAVQRPAAIYPQSIADGDTTPSVAGFDYFETANTSPTTITDFDDGLIGQDIWVQIGDANTTIDFTSSGLIGNGGADWTPSSDDFMLCKYDGTDWNCFISSGTTSESNDLTASVTWANVPNANITESSVTQHEAAIDHDALTNFLANEHIDWTSTSSNFNTSGTVGTGALSVTGNISVTGTVDGRDVAADGAVVDANTVDVTLAGTPDYITISGQEITRNQIDLTSDVTGDLPAANVASGTLTGHELVDWSADTYTYSEATGTNADTINADQYSYYNLPMSDPDITGDVTLTMAAPGTGYREVLIRIQQGSTSRDVTWAGGTFQWIGGTEPVLSDTNGDIDLVHLFTTDNGTTWTGSYALASGNGSGGANALTDLTDVGTAATTSGYVLVGDGSVYTGRALTTSDIGSGTFANGRISEASVTQHEAALSITESQISDLGVYAESLTELSDVSSAATTSGYVLVGNGSTYAGRALTSGDLTDVTAFAETLLDDANAAAARTTLDVDQSGTDNSTDVTLAGTPDYITISGQTITRNQVDLTADVTGNLPAAEIAAGTLTGMQLKDYSVTYFVVQEDVSTANQANFDFDDGNSGFIDLGDPDFTADPTLVMQNVPSGHVDFVLRVMQHSTTRDITWPSSFKWPGGTAPTLTTGDGSIDIIQGYTTDSGTTFYCTFAQDFS